MIYTYILLDPNLDVVDICLPSHVHRSHAVDALKHGKHVFSETPVCFDLEDALLMKQAEQQYGKKVLVNKRSISNPPIHTKKVWITHLNVLADIRNV
ncbi:Gfo/Idh/MocA family protein [Paenibacillus terrae]|uniref:Gfo/Idh/MocA family protein n=1 Tax=Paenibacillus terrae TaxID=159743 RepID=UPI0021CD069B|nr:Gfo/Idh/MocA family oxidoreductase [Paenibacillus terrae]